MKAQDLDPILLLIACLTLSPMAQAVLPPPDGGYPGGNTAEGQAALFSLTTGTFNTAVGFFSLRSNATGSENTAIGAGALFLNSASANTAIGAGALLSNTTGISNTATGDHALFNSATGSENTANGHAALSSNTIGDSNTATGNEALEINTTGHNNTANGSRALADNTTGNLNTANGAVALESNTTGGNNTANGFGALNNNSSGANNTATGNLALATNSGGNSNTANGFQALFNNINGSFNTSDGVGALFNCTGTGNIGVGANAGANVTTASNAIVIGTAGANVSNSCFIGNIRGVTTSISNAIPVLIDSAGQLGTMSSSRRFKKEIKRMEQVSEAILALKPVTFHYKSDKTKTPQFGLIAEEVADVNPDLVVRDKEGKPYSVRYEAVNAMLLNEFLKEHKKVEGQQVKIGELNSRVARQDATIALQRKGIELLTARLNEQATQIQKVSAQVELRNPASQMVLNKE